ncbi:hypothetical protein HJC23_010044 [Cyclotella cryptica]|uniref:Uncharacterized protein n=1 Tax=Cyclotella cryptica TaxID=29204 RepID=A0ABD3P001_9STRA
MAIEGLQNLRSPLRVVVNPFRKLCFFLRRFLLNPSQTLFTRYRGVPNVDTFPSDFIFLVFGNRSTVSRTVIRAEDTDYEKEFAKLQKEAEERLDDKVAELMSNIETVGQKK